MVSPLACQVGSCLVWACCFSRLVLFGLVPSPPPCGVGPVVFLVGPAPPVGGSVFYRGMVWLLPLVSSNVIVTCLVPSPPVGWGLWSFWLAPPSLCGAVCSTEIWYGCCHLLVVMSSLRARYHTKYDVALFSLASGAPCPCSDAVLRSCEEALAGIILHRPPSLWFAWVRSGCPGPLGAGAACGRGPGTGIPWGGGVGCGGPGPESIYTRDLLQALLGVPRELNIYYLALRNQALQPKP